MFQDDDTANSECGGKDWIDEALERGMGFKSPEEKSNYIKSIGDPLKHPMFATSTQDLVGNPLADAIRVLREEDKTNTELILMYKDEGNQLLKKGEYQEAIYKYDYALTFVQKALNEKRIDDEKSNEIVNNDNSSNNSNNNSNSDTIVTRNNNISINDNNNDIQKPNVDKESTDTMMELKSQLYNNKALISLQLKNYRTCIIDSDIAINCQPFNNIKAYYRKCKALYNLKEYIECIEIYQKLQKEQKVENIQNNKEFIELIKLCEDGLNKMKLLQQDKEVNAKKFRIECEVNWNIILKIQDYLKSLPSITNNSNTSNSNSNTTTTTGSSNSSNNNSSVLTIGYNINEPPAQLRGIYPSYNKDDHTYQIPLLCLYPQYNQLDVIPDTNIQAMLVEYLSYMFPEKEADTSENTSNISWDIYNEYHISNLVVYILLENCPKISTKEEWINNCLEEKDITGVNGHDNATNAIQQMTLRQQIHMKYHHNKYQNQHNCPYLEIHLGCTIGQILTIPGHILSSGRLNLLIYVRNNEAHQKFLNNLKRDNCTYIGVYQPNNTITQIPL